MAVSVQESILSGRTLNIRDHNEVIALLERHHIKKTSYYQLGLRLLLSDNTLRSIEQEHRGQVDRCFTECLASWLRKADDVETPTIDTLIAALRGIGENAVADSITGERQRSEIINYDRPTATPMLEVNEDHSDQPMILGVHVHEMENKMKSHPELHPIAFSLQQKYCDLVADVRQSLIDHKIDIEGIKLVIKAYLTGETQDHLMLKKCIDLLQKICDFNSLFHFLIDNHFIGYLNYNLLKRISKRISQDISLMNQVDDYEKKYAELLNEISCNDLVHLFNEWSHLSPNSPVGLPCITFRLGSPWLHSRFYTWFSTFGEFSWSYYAFLKQLRKNCVIITYAILPCVLDDVMRDLKDPVILKELKDKGITVIELPQDEEDYDSEEEDPQIESIAKIEPVSRVDTFSNIQTTSSEGNIPTTSTTTADCKTPLFNAVKSHNIKDVDILLTNGARTDVVSKYVGTPLHCATETGNANIIKLLITKGKADVNALDKLSRTPLFNAVKSGNIEVVDILLANGARTDVVDKDGETLLHYAGESGQVEMLVFLMRRGDYDVNVKDKGNRTPLFNAVKSGNVEAVDILLTNGARTDVVSTYDGTPLHYATKRNETEIIELLITKGKADVNAVDTWNRTPLFEAIDSIKAVNILLTNGARTDVVDTFGDTPLILAKSRLIEKHEVIRLLTGQVKLTAAYEKGRELIESIESYTKPEEIIGLLQAGADPNVTEYPSGGSPALIIAIEKGNIDIVKLLLEKGADPNVTEDGKSLLHYASESDNVEMLEFWIKRGDYDVNVKEKNNRTPLFNAVKSGNIETVDILLTNGARTDVVDKYYGTPLHCASETGNANIIKLLITKGNADVNAVDKDNSTPLFNAVKSGSIEAVDVLLTNGARTDVVSKGSFSAGIFYHGTPLHCASATGNANIIKLLITKGNADVNAVDEDGETLLHCAGESEMLEFWIKRGDYDVNVKHKWTRTPLFNAVESGSIGAVDTLLTNGARTDVVDKYGDTPLLLAVERHRSAPIINLLIIKGQADVTTACKKYQISPELSRPEIAELLITKSMFPSQHWIPISSSRPERRRMSPRPEGLRYYKAQSSMFSSPRRERHEMSTSYHDDDEALTELATASMSSSRPERLHYYKAQSSMFSSPRRERHEMPTSYYDDEALIASPSSSYPERHLMPIFSPMLVSSSRPERRRMSSQSKRLHYYEAQSIINVLITKARKA